MIDENIPLGKLQRSRARAMASHIHWWVPRWLLCALTITGFPEAKAEAVSPPAVENAKGKLDAPNTAIGPKGTRHFLISDFGKGWRSGSAVSIEASTQNSSWATSANNLNCPKVLPVSP